ncbi:MAG TPA: hypothetical protein DCY35_12110 [Prolixibacteraceae bacterium]|nr:hypothetical protein [Prolixibacteraceae bacterium]
MKKLAKFILSTGFCLVGLSVFFSCSIEDESALKEMEIKVFGEQNRNIPVSMAKAGKEDALVPYALLDKIDVSSQVYDAARKTVTVRYSGNEYVFTLGAYEATKNGSKISLPLAPRLDGDTVMMPAAFLLKEFQAKMVIGENLEIYVPTVVTNPTLAWSGEQYLNGSPLDYLVQIAKDKNFRSIVLTDKVAFTGQYVPVDALTPDEYWWRVKPMTDPDLSTGWSEPQWFKIIAPEKEYTVKAGSTAEQIHNVIQEAAQNTPALVKFEKGEYHVSPSFQYLKCQPDPSQYGGGVNPPGLIELIGAKNLVIEGNGSTVCIDNESSILKAFVSKNLILRNITFTTHMPLKPAGRIVGVNTAASTLQFELLEGQVTPEEKPDYYKNFNEGFAVTDSSGATKRGVLTRMRHAQIPGKVSGRVYQVTVTEARSVASFAKDLAVGDFIYFVPKQGGAYGAMGIFAEYCEDLTLYNVRKTESGGYSYIIKNCEKLKFLKFIDKPRSVHDHSEGGLIGSGRTGIWMEDCEFWNYSDDGPQNSTEPIEIYMKPSSNMLILKQDTELRGSMNLPDMNFALARYWKTNNIRPGDQLMIYTNQIDPGDVRYTVKDAVFRAGYISVTLDRSIPESTVIELSKPFPSGKTVVVNTSSRQTGAAYRNCLFKNIARNGIYGAAADFLIENCRFEDIGETGLRVADFVTADCANILIRNNVIERSNLNCTALEAVSIGVLMYDRANTWKNGMKNVYILNNRIIDRNKVGFYIWATDNLLIEGNILENKKYTNYGYHSPSWGTTQNEILRLKDCRNAVFQNNSILDTRPLPVPYIKTAVDGFKAAGNMFSNGYKD